MQMLFLDLDDTLIRSDGTISAKNREALYDLNKREIPVVLCTGRPAASVKPLCKELFGDRFDGYYIGFNGAAVVRWQTGEEIFRQPLDREAARFIVRFAREKGILAQVYQGERFFIEKEDPKAVEYSDRVGIGYDVVPSLEQFLTFDPLKILFNSEESRLVEIYDELLSHDRLGFTAVFSRPWFLELLHPRVNKGTALTFLADYLQIPLNRVVAVGDSLNDIEMIQAAGIGAAVANARTEVLEAADFVTVNSCDDDGVAELIQKFFPVPPNRNS